MKRKKKNHDQYYICSSCGSGSFLYLGSCVACGKFDTFQVPNNVEDSGYSNQREMFNKIWALRPHTCCISGEDLNPFYGTEKYYACFAHILRKGHWTKYKLREENIMLLHPDIHTLIDQGTIEQRNKYTQMTGKSFKPFYDEQERLKELYKKETRTP